MASATNIENLATAGLGSYEVRPNDLIVAVSGSEEACVEALARADELLKESAAGAGDADGEAPQPITSLQMAVSKDPANNFALVSVPGDYAAAEAMKALRLGMDVMIFSDNVPVESERTLKLYAQKHNLMVMGPDCGTAIVNGVPLGFANVVRRRPDMCGRRFRHRHTGSDRAHSSAWFGRFAGARHRRARPGRFHRWHLHAARAQGAR